MNNYIFIDNYSDEGYLRVVADNDVSAQIQVVKHILEKDPNNWECIEDALDIKLMNVSKIPFV